MPRRVWASIFIEWLKTPISHMCASTHGRQLSRAKGPAVLHTGFMHESGKRRGARIEREPAIWSWQFRSEEAAVRAARRASKYLCWSDLQSAKIKTSRPHICILICLQRYLTRVGCSLPAPTGSALQPGLEHPSRSVSVATAGHRSNRL